MTVLYLDPDNDTFMAIKHKLQSMTTPPPQDPAAPEHISSDLYDEIYCVVDMLRPADFHPTKGWLQLK